MIRRKLLTSALALASSLAATAAVDFTGVQKLAGRVSADLAAKVTFTELVAEGDQAVIASADGKIAIRATNPRAASLALGRYIRDVAKGHISWCGNRIPSEWPLPSGEITVKPLHPYAIAYNYCTISYTMAFWDQADWQKEIDRLALQGYNVALMTAGLQKVWDLTLTDMGYSETQRKNYISDDAAAAWWHMGNLEGLGSVSAADIERDAALGKWMVGAMREVGIEPIFQGFVGLIPSSTTDSQLTDSNIFRTGYWVAGRKNPDILDPTCGAFKTFSEKWYDKLKTVYGLTDAADYPKFLGGDLFHESSPPGSMSAEEQRLCAVKAQSYQQDAFPGVTWILQSWQGSPVQNLRNGLDPKYTLIQALDQGMHNTGRWTSSYVNNTTGEYLPWVWVEVMNFGGNTGMHGAFRRFRNIGNIPGSGTALANSFKGYGLLSEGLETNPSSYDLFADTFTKADSASQNVSDAALPAWLEDYRLRRYGYTDDNLKLAHYICSTSVWDCAKDQQGTVESVFCAYPAYGITCVSKWGPKDGTPYPRKVLVEAARLYLATAKNNPELLDLETFRYDFVEIFQQILADKAREILPQCASSKRSRDEFMVLLDLVERILACSDEWRLDKKEARVKTKAPDTGVAAYRRMITTWTPSSGGQTVLSEYAHRSYAGLMKHFYAKRWRAFFDIADGTRTQTEYNSFIAELNTSFPVAELEATPEDGDPIAIAEEILANLEPPVLTWNDAAGDNAWRGANWTDTAGATVAWSDGLDVVVSGVGETISAADGPVVGNLEVATSLNSSQYVYGGENGVYIDASTELGWSGLTLDDLAAGEFTGIFSGAWMSDEKPACKGYHVTRHDDMVTVQMQVLHNSYVKVVSLALTIGDDGQVCASYQWANNGDSASLGKEFTRWDTPASSSKPEGYENNVLKYGIIGLSFYPPSSVTVTGPLTILGAVRLDGSESLSLPDVTGIPRLEVASGAPVLVLGANQKLTVNDVEIASGAKLVIKGAASTLTGAADAAGIKFVSTTGEALEIASGSVVYVCTTAGDANYGTEQELVVDAAGNLKRKLVTMTSTGFLTKDYVSLGWTNVTLDELAKMEFTGTMTGGWMGDKDESGNIVSYRHVAVRGCHIEKSGETVVLWMQCVDDGFLKGMPVTLKIENGVVYAKGADCKNKEGGSFGYDFANGGGNASIATSENTGGYGVYGLTANPSVGRVADTGANYASLTDAIDAAKKTESKALSVIGDVEYATSRGLTDGIVLTVEEGVALKAGVNDGTDWGGSCEVIVKGILDLDDHRWTFSSDNVLTLYTGATVRGSGDGSNNGAVVEIHGSEHVVAVRKGTGEKARLACAVGLSASVVFDVEEGALLELGSTNGGNLNGPERTITKRGLGTLEITGDIYAYATVVTGDEASGVLTRVLPPLTYLKVRKGAGEVDVVVASSDPDYKITETVDGDLTTYTSVKCIWVANVTNVEDAREDSEGTKYESLEEAIAALPTTPNGRLWLMGEFKESVVAPEGWVKEASPYGTELWKIAARLNGTDYRTLAEAIDAFKPGDELILVDTSLAVPDGWEISDGKLLPSNQIFWSAGNEWTGSNTVFIDGSGDAVAKPAQNAGVRIVLNDNREIYYIGDGAKGNDFVVTDADIYAMNQGANWMLHGSDLTVLSGSFNAIHNESQRPGTNRGWGNVPKLGSVTVTTKGEGEFRTSGELKIGAGEYLEFAGLLDNVALRGKITGEAGSSLIVSGTGTLVLTNTNSVPSVTVSDGSAVMLGEGAVLTTGSGDLTLSAPEGYGVARTAVEGGFMYALRRLVYWKSGDFNPGVVVWSNAAQNVETTFNAAGDLLRFTADATVYPAAGFAVPLYLSVEDGKKLRVGHATKGENFNLPTGSVVELGKGTELEFIYWGNNSAQGAASLGDLTVNGEGTFGYDKVNSNPMTAGNITGTATLVIEDGEHVTAASVSNPVVLKGSATLTLTTEGVSANVTLEAEVPSFGGTTVEDLDDAKYLGYFTKKAVNNEDGTFTISAILNPEVVRPAVDELSVGETAALTIAKPLPGLYYSVKTMTEVNGDVVATSDAVLATSDDALTLTPVLPMDGGKAPDKAFFKAAVDFLPEVKQ